MVRRVLFLYLRMHSVRFAPIGYLFPEGTFADRKKPGFLSEPRLSIQIN
ncbi:unknown [Alistipes putredinis CAG:67]|nr:unknown [Alistipes putredinis CAG:67]